MKKILLLLGCLLVVGSAEAKLLDMVSFVLPNGLQVAVVENHKAPVVLQMLYYKTGSADDPKGKGGIAHLLEHVMFRGTKEVPGQMFNKLTDEHGAANNAYTTYKETAYYEFTDISKLELMMALEADRMTGLNFDEDAFLKERDIVLEERMQRYETQPAALFYETLNKMLWQDHPLSNPISGSVSEIKNLALADARAFYEAYYHPGNALLVLGGDITPKEAKELANKYYGKLKAKGENIKRFVPEGKVAATELNMELQGVEQMRCSSLIRLNGGAFSKTDILALELLSDYLAGDDTSYLYDKLVYQKKTLLSVGSAVSYDDELGGVVSFSVVPASESAKPQDIRQLLEKTTADALKVLTEEKLTQLKNQALSAAIYLQEDPRDAAKFVGAMLLSGYTPEEIATYDESLKAITKKDILAAWEKVRSARVKVFGCLRGVTKGAVR